MSELYTTVPLATLGTFPEEFWDVQDDHCDCTFQRIGMWTNPYLGETLEVRMCCIWEELYKLFPDKVRRTSAFLDYNRNEWNPTPQEWDGEDDMPSAIWHRQLSRKTGKPLAAIRAEYANQEPPKGKPRPVVEPEPGFADVLFQMVIGLADEVGKLREEMEAKA